MKQSPQILGGCHWDEAHALKNRSAELFPGKVGCTTVLFCVVLLLLDVNILT